MLLTIMHDNTSPDSITPKSGVSAGDPQCSYGAVQLSVSSSSGLTWLGEDRRAIMSIRFLFGNLSEPGC